MTGTGAAPTLPLSETFGPTLQGEGPDAGRLCWFIRFGGCNLACSWCDTPYTWDAGRFDLRAEMHPVTAGEIVEKITAPPGTIVVLSGGETLLHQHNEAWNELLEKLIVRGLRVHVETNGTIPPTAATETVVEQFSVSPKQAHAGPHKRSQNAQPWAGWPSVPAAVLKVVVRDADDVAAAARTALEAGWPRDRTWVMPLGATAGELAARWPAVATAAAEWGINATHRLHVLAWQDERGH